ncbi:hypothetical protein FEDK69T_31750 [Flavobacterium enshiense DK69]|uniref:Uncharacterized protein n=1 Tax=Flavobacterium enshiense DK69 TaxID=1107311 RepID=V6RZ63_9FLAO|nr:hypothetical protein [Flavobacterium enshiense]ESU19459.1 hypothetical protein FEDK69T_31750 [Flavobacterium enshiense DK69]KGO92160.1 hypothetical protein Q767_15715 [Flavobacterium enshiense DK69]
MEFYDFENQINQIVKTGNIQDAIQETEAKFKTISETEFHKVIGRDLLHLKNDVDEFLNALLEKSKEDLDDEIKAIYVEMNGFTINYDMWFTTGASFTFCNDSEDTDWLADYDYFFEMAMIISGFEDLQKVYEDYMVNEKWEIEGLEMASDFCALLITLRLLELFKASFEKFNNNSEWTNIPVFVTSHDSETLYCTIGCS